MRLAEDPGRPSAPSLIARVLGAELRAARRRMALRLGLGLRRLHEALPQDWRKPDSPLAQKAEALAQAVCQPFILAHSHRTYCFGALLAARDGLKLDREALFVASILHDLGLSETHQDAPGSFEWVSARLAHAFCLQEGVAEDKAALIHDAVALHSSVGIADRLAPEIAMTHLGAGVDLFGLQINEVPARALAQILEERPREGFKACLSQCVNHQATTKPDSHIAGLAGMGMNGRIKERLGPKR